MKLDLKGQSLDLSARTAIMGILNVTPDSFSDGNKYLDTGLAIERALQMVGEGADIIDIGGESTRPGSVAVSLQEELRRVIPVIEAVASRISIPVSIDTYKAAVAREAIAAGASIINDISGLRFDPEMAAVAASSRVAVMLMHIKGTPKDMQLNPEYTALIPEIMDYLRLSIQIAEESGVHPSMIVIDPGIGFGKSLEHNLEIIRNLQEFEALGRPILVGVSRKAFIGKILGDAPASDRLEGTAAAVTAAILSGANIIRVHDVKEMAKVAKVADAVKRGRI